MEQVLEAPGKGKHKNKIKMSLWSIPCSVNTRDLRRELMAERLHESFEKDKWLETKNNRFDLSKREICGLYMDIVMELSAKGIGLKKN